jgi:hypothetical protein
MPKNPKWCYSSHRFTWIADRPSIFVQLTFTGRGPCRQRITVCLSPRSAASKKILSCGSIRCPSLSGSNGGSGHTRRPRGPNGLIRYPDPVAVAAAADEEEEAFCPEVWPPDPVDRAAGDRSALDAGDCAEDGDNGVRL